MKIVYCVYKLSEGGGVSRVLTTKANYLVKKGYDITIITATKEDKDTFYPLDKRVQTLSFNLKYEGQVYNKPIWKRFFYALHDMWDYRQQMRDFIKTHQPDIIVTTHLLLTFLLPSIKDKTCKIQEIHGSKYMYRGLRPIPSFSPKQLLIYLQEQRDKFFMRFFDAVVNLTEKDKNLRGNPKNMHVIYNPIHFSSSNTSNLEKKEALALGRYTEEKDFSSLLDIWAMAVKSCPDWHLTIVGQGYLKKNLQEKITKLGIENTVTLLEEQKDVESLYLNSSIYVMTSRFEGLPMVLLESQAMGLPITSYDCPCGPSDVITNGEDGFLIMPNDKEGFAKYLIQLMENENLRKQMGRKAKENSKRFEVETIMPQWENLFKNLIQQKNGK